MPEGLIGIIGGTGLGDALIERIVDSEVCDVDTPFGKPSGKILVGTIGRNKVAFINRHGAGHKLSPSEIPFAANIFSLKKLGVRTVIASGSVGSLRGEINPGDLVIADQFIDKTSKRQNSLFTGFGAVHCEFSEPTCSRVRNILYDTAKKNNISTNHKGTYICMEGPQFSTRAESLMHRSWGADLIGMTAMPEAKLAREAQLCYAMVALVSDYDCWCEQVGHQAKRDKQTLLEEIISNLQTATRNCLELIKSVLNNETELVYNECSCRKSLDLAVWTDKNQIEKDYKEKLKVLFE